MKTSFYVAVVSEKWLGLLERERAGLLDILADGFLTYREWNDLFVIASTIDREEITVEARNKFGAFCEEIKAMCGESAIAHVYERTGDYEFQL